MTDNKVTDSFETPDGGRCVDIFQRRDGTWGFEEYRRDVEDGTGWFQIGFHRERVYETRQRAIEAARESVTWFCKYADRL